MRAGRATAATARCRPPAPPARCGPAPGRRGPARSGRAGALAHAAGPAGRRRWPPGVGSRPVAPRPAPHARRCPRALRPARGRGPRSLSISAVVTATASSGGTGLGVEADPQRICFRQVHPLAARGAGGRGFAKAAQGVPRLCACAACSGSGSATPHCACRCFNNACRAWASASCKLASMKG